MSQVAKLFNYGRSQAVHLPATYRFSAKEVFIRQDPVTGDIILSRKPATWDGFFEAVRALDLPTDFLDAKEREHATANRDPFEGCAE